MVIKCKATKGFLMNVDIEAYHCNLKKMGIDVVTPLLVEIPCKKCKMIEVYEIYPNHYVHIKSYKNNCNIAKY